MPPPGFAVGGAALCSEAWGRGGSRQGTRKGLGESMLAKLLPQCAASLFLSYSSQTYRRLSVPSPPPLLSSGQHYSPHLCPRH